MVLPENVISYLDKILQSGFDAYVVGGAPRDILMGKIPTDFDVATSATTEELKSVFKGERVIETGVKHGTLSIMYNGEIFETTTFRIDGEYSDNRHPDSVSFSRDIKTDLERRDFTVNAIAVSVSGEIIDPFGGIEDIKRGVIRCVGNAEKRFEEDALRILRAIRFASKTGFKIDKDTFFAMLDKKCLLSSVSKERIYQELTKTLLGEFAAQAIGDYKEIIFEILPVLRAQDGFDQKSLSHCFDVFSHTLAALSLLREKNAVTAWATLFHDAGKPFTFVVDSRGYGHFPNHMEVSANIAEKVLKELKAPSDLIRRVTTIIRFHDEPLSSSRYEVKKFLSLYGEEILKDLITLKFADIYAHSEHGIKKYSQERILLKRYFEEIVENGDCYKLSDLCVNGSDIASIGFCGKEIGDILDRLLDAVMKGEAENNREKLLDLAKQWKQRIRPSS